LKGQFERVEGSAIEKDKVFEDHVLMCEHLEASPLDPSTFARVLKEAFPDIKTRRLGSRGNVKIHYWGLARKPPWHISKVTTSPKK